MRQGCLIRALGRVRSMRITRNKERNPAALKAHQNYGSTPTMANSRRRTAKQVPRVGPSSPASLDAGFVEISYVQLS